MRRYELMLLLRPDLDDERLQGAVERVTRAIVNAGGSLSKVSPWGKRRLAYEIGHQREASYFLIHFEIEPGAIRGIERGLLISEEILRHMVTILDERSTGREPDSRAGRGGPRPALGERDRERKQPPAGELDVEVGRDADDEEEAAVAIRVAEPELGDAETDEDIESDEVREAESRR